MQDLTFPGFFLHSSYKVIGQLRYTYHVIKRTNVTTVTRDRDMIYEPASFSLQLQH